jgi:hypothetical protein
MRPAMLRSILFAGLGATLSFTAGCGSSTACTAGEACGSSNPCHVATIQCYETPVCVDAGDRPDGFVCGSGQACLAGTCTACANQACTPANPCHFGTLSCSGTTASCADSGTPKPDGTSCGTKLSCFAGICSRTVSGSRLLTYWPDSGKTTVVPDNSALTIQAFVPDGAGGTATRAGAWAPDGSFKIPNVPQGSYLLDLAQSGFHQVVETSAATVDLGSTYLGRPDQSGTTGATPVTYSVSGLEPWTATPAPPNTGVGDNLWVVSSNANAVTFPIGPFYGVDFSNGATSGTATVTWRTNLIDAVKGDNTYFYQLAAKQAGGLPYQTATRSSYLSSFTVADKIPVTANVALSPIVRQGSLVVDWRLSEFDAHLTDINPAAALLDRSIYVRATPHTLLDPSPLVAAGGPLLFSLHAGPNQPDLNLGALNYGQVFDLLFWKEWRGVNYAACVSLTAPGATSGLRFCGNMTHEGVAMSPAPPTPVVPALTPPKNPLIDGLDAFQANTGVSTTPTLSWSPPGVGTPTHYRIWILRLDTAGTRTAPFWVADLLTASPRLKLPPGLLQPGKSYFAFVFAYGLPADSFDLTPFEAGAQYASASTLTGVFSTSP